MHLHLHPLLGAAASCRNSVRHLIKLELMSVLVVQFLKSTGYKINEAVDA